MPNKMRTSICMPLQFSSPFSHRFFFHLISFPADETITTEPIVSINIFSFLWGFYYVSRSKLKKNCTIIITKKIAKRILKLFHPPNNFVPIRRVFLYLIRNIYYLRSNGGWLEILAMLDLNFLEWRYEWEANGIRSNHQPKNFQKPRHDLRASPFHPQKKPLKNVVQCIFAFIISTKQFFYFLFL